MMQKRVDGRHAKMLNARTVKNIAMVISRMHKNLLKAKLEGGDSWRKAHQFRKRTLLLNILGFKAREEYDTLLAQLQRAVDPRKLRTAIIHCDLSPNNFLIKNDRLAAILDWDDAHKDFIVYDVAIFVARAFVRRNAVNKNLLKLFLKTYQKTLPLNDEEKKVLYYFIKNRFISSINFGGVQLRKHKDKARWIKKWIRMMISCYKTFNSLNVGEFCSLY